MHFWFWMVHAKDKEIYIPTTLLCKGKLSTNMGKLSMQSWNSLPAPQKCFKGNAEISLCHCTDHRKCDSELCLNKWRVINNNCKSTINREKIGGKSYLEGSETSQHQRVACQCQLAQWDWKKMHRVPYVHSETERLPGLLHCKRKASQDPWVTVMATFVTAYLQHCQTWSLPSCNSQLPSNHRKPQALCLSMPLFHQARKKDCRLELQTGC